MMERREDGLLKALQGLEGGTVACGSTCGVVTGGSVGIALMHDAALQERGAAAEAGVMSLVGDYVKWFQGGFGSNLCREITGVDFYSALGQLRYFLPGDRVGKCLWHMRGAARYLYSLQQKDLPGMDAGPEEVQGEPLHCAKAVLTGIRERTGLGTPLLERLSFIFDGGVGYQGGVCGALAGAVMGINLLLGMDVRTARYARIIKAFVVGHVNLLLNKPLGKPEPFGTGKTILERFKEEAGAVECRSITGKAFSGPDDFQRHMSCSDRCAGLIELATAGASDAIQRLRRKGF
jgi:C_GCAxxG_C_C family probable redox protein